MFTRRKFLKVFGLAGLAFSFVPTIFAKGSVSKAQDCGTPGFRVRGRLYGSSRRGCSTPGLTSEHLGEAGRDLQDFVYRASHGQFLS